MRHSRYSYHTEDIRGFSYPKVLHTLQIKSEVLQLFRRRYVIFDIIQMSWRPQSFFKYLRSVYPTCIKSSNYSDIILCYARPFGFFYSAESFLQFRLFQRFPVIERSIKSEVFPLFGRWNVIFEIIPSSGEPLCFTKKYQRSSLKINIRGLRMRELSEFSIPQRYIQKPQCYLILCETFEIFLSSGTPFVTQMCAYILHMISEIRQQAGCYTFLCKPPETFHYLSEDSEVFRAPMICKQHMSVVY